MIGEKIDNRWHFLGFLLVFLAVLSFCFYQLFVDQNYRRISPLVFLKPPTLRLAWENLFVKPPKVETINTFYLESKNLYQNILSPRLIRNFNYEVKDQQFFLSPNQDKLAFLTPQNQLLVLGLVKGEILDQHQFPPGDNLQIIHWQKNNKKLFGAKRDDGGWSIWELDEETNKVTELKNGIQYNHDNLTRVYAPIEEKIVYPVCQKICQLEVLNVDNKELIQAIPAIIDNDPMARIDDLIFAFYDEAHGLIAYQKIERNVAGKLYVINFNQDLLQIVQLLLNGDTRLEFVTYFPLTQGILFSSRSQTIPLELFLYAANKPSLKLLGHYNREDTVYAVDNLGLYRIGNSVLKSTFDGNFLRKIENKEVISTL
ncbi:hypothetical protein A2160_02905 [Candidatus Beckwithbacteria bacterium RBG_13_42_9]|uniref:Dipeptidylpeptidase IV N-terminal domain-containing protein n=1 Tax=Candidatus Beckwithbacteria bacterium RBG_13_42_9 TaxID=1797457 RepID=A0A1F5E7S3_9BACT|nr:MAG: hypothetical protein A2160_02905 [Candidatus Beckwithbacteria bacterium RBG_13_42_9]